MMKGNTTLAKRGKKLADADNLREKFSNIFNNLYDPDTNPDGLVNMGVAENYAMFPEVREFINGKLTLSRREFSYDEGPWGTRRLRKAMAAHMTKAFNAIEEVNPDDILIMNGVTSICETLGFTICDPGDAVLYPAPIYQAFEMDFGLKAGVASVYTDFGDVDQFSVEAVEKYEEALLKAEKAGTRVRAFMLCNPHNPLGRCYPKDTIIALMKLCDKYKIHLLADEVYAFSVYEIDDPKAVHFTSVLSFDYSEYIDPNLVHVIYGMSKDFACGGLRLGCFLSRNKELVRSLGAISQFHWAGNPSQAIATVILEDEEWLDKYQILARERLSSLNRLTRDILEKAGIKYYPGANAGFFLWADLRPFLPLREDFENNWEREGALVKKMMEGKVFITAGQGLHAAEPGWFRIIFSQDQRTLLEGMDRLIKAIKNK